MDVIDLAKKSGDLAPKIGGMLALAGLLALTGEQQAAAKLIGAAEKK